MIVTIFKECQMTKPSTIIIHLGCVNNGPNSTDNETHYYILHLLA